MKTVCGLDIHKDSVFVCILNESGKKIESKIGVLTKELVELRQLLIENNVSEVAMESTSIYWCPVWGILEGICTLYLINPYFIKQLPGRKSDIKDAAWIAECVLKKLIRGSFVPPKLVQDMRYFNRRIYDLNKDIVRKRAKLDAVLQRCNIRLSNYVSTTTGKAYQEIINLICKGIVDPTILIERVHGRTINRHGREVICASLEGNISRVDILIMGQLKAEIDFAELHKEECQNELNNICKIELNEDFEHILSIPGVKNRAATAILSEIGPDMTSFETPSALVSWCGLRPSNEESAGKIKSRKITHGNRYIRQTMIECAWSASRTQDCYFSNFFIHQTAVRKKTKMKVIVAIARKLLIAIWHILKKKECYLDYSKLAQIG